MVFVVINENKFHAAQSYESIAFYLTHQASRSLAPGWDWQSSSPMQIFGTQDTHNKQIQQSKEPLTMSIDWDTMSLQIMLPWVSFPQSVTEDVKLGKNKILKWRTRYGWVSLMTSSLIYFGTDPRKHRIHLFYISNDVKSYVINVSVLW